MKVIAVTGYKRCGKDTFVKHFIEEAKKQNKSVKRIAFADKVKEYIRELYGYPKTYLEKMKDTNERIESGLMEYNVRDLMIKVAESLKKISKNPAIWAKMTINEILESKNYDYVVISDLRFPIEYGLLKKFFNDNLTIVRIHWTENPECQENSNEIYIKKIDYDFFIENKKDDLKPIYRTIQQILNQGE